MARPQVWRKPVLNTAEDEHRDRRVTWIELFFDLFFVVTVGQLAHYLALRMNWTGVFEYLLLFVPVWWVWIGYTVYNERFESGGAENRIFAFLIMIPSAGLAVFVHGAFKDTYTGFALSYAIARAVITFLWIRGAYYNKPARSIGVIYGSGFITSIILVVISVFMDVPYRYWMFGTALFIDLATPLTTVELTSYLPRFSTSKLPERFGLFTLIVLGESIVGVLGTVAGEHHITGKIILTSIAGIAISFCMWWIYFYYIGRRPFANKTYLTFVWAYLHMPLVMAIAMSGACLSNVINQSNEKIVDPNVRILMCFSVFAVLLFASCIELTLRRDKNEPTHVVKSTFLKVITGILIFFVGLVGTSFSSIELLLSIIVLLVANMAYGFFSYYGHEVEN